MCLLRLLELSFFLYFATHIPITILFDSQVVASDLNIPQTMYPQQVQDLVKWYVAEFKDPYFVNPPKWYKSFVICEMFTQLPFFFIACFAMLLGSRPWIKSALLVYSAHVATTVYAILYSFAYDDFAKMKRVGPVTQEERLRLMAIYSPYIIFPVLMILTMMMSSSYSPTNVTAPESKATTSQKKKHFKKQ